MSEEHIQNAETDAHVKRLRNGSLLLASDELSDPHFHESLVLVCIHNNDGAFGLVCNRPSHMPLTEVFNIDPVYQGMNRSIYMGGPVDEDVLNILHITDSPVENAYTVQNRVRLGGEWSSLENILGEDPSDIRLFLGYSGWNAGQLTAEIAQGDWEVYNVDLEQFLKDWEEPIFGDTSAIRSYLQGISTDHK